MSVDRFKLIGTYATPAFRIGDRTRCEVRGELLVCGLHDGPIPWPVGKLSPRARARSIIVYGGLAEAVRVESEQAVAHWFGVRPVTVWTWRRALGVGATTEGTSKLRSEYAFEPAQTEARSKADQRLSDPERCARSLRPCGASPGQLRSGRQSARSGAAKSTAPRPGRR